MSNVFFPRVDGIGNPIHLKVEAFNPQFSTQVQRGMGGTEFRVSRWASPRWSWRVSVPVLPNYSRADSLQTIEAFFMARRGMADSFLWCPPEDAATVAGSFAGAGARCDNVTLGIGDGVRTTFPLVRPYGGANYPYGAAAEPVYWVDLRTYGVVCRTGAMPVTIAGLVRDGAIGPLSMQLEAAPASGQIVTADFEMAYRVRFGKDSQEFKAWARQLWRGGTIELEQVFE